MEVFLLTLGSPLGAGFLLTSPALWYLQALYGAGQKEKTRPILAQPTVTSTLAPLASPFFFDQPPLSVSQGQVTLIPRPVKEATLNRFQVLTFLPHRALFTSFRPSPSPVR